MQSLNLNDAKLAVAHNIASQLAAVQAKQTELPVHLMGDPGIGKSEVVYQAAKDYLGDDAKVIEFRGPTRDVVDALGLPSVTDGHTVWNRPDFIPEDGEGVLFIDEYKQCAPAMQAALSELVLCRRCGSHQLGDGWAIVAASNHDGTKCGTHRTLEHMKSRFEVIHCELDVDTWCNWALDHGIAPEVIAFIRFRPALLSTFDPSTNQESYATPRGYASISRLLSVPNGKPASEPENDAECSQNARKRQIPAIPAHVEYAKMQGKVGEEAATELSAFIRLARELPSPDAVIADPLNQPLPDSPAAKYAIATAIASRATCDNLNRVMQYADRLDPEFATLVFVDVTRTKSKDGITSCAAYTEWAVRNSDVLT